jgi:methionine-rich copper-binding protein CopC
MNILRSCAPLTLALVMAVASSHATADGARAHARFIESDPAPDAVLDAGPGWVTIWFGEILEYQGNSIQVLDPGGARVDLGDVTLLDGNHKAMWVSLTSGLGVGAYQVIWSNVSAEDGHPANGEYWFTYAPAATGEPVFATQAAEPS